MTLRITPLHAALAACFMLPASQAFADTPSVLPAVEVVGQVERPSYRASSQSSAGFGDKALLDTPFSVGVATEQLMRDQIARSLPDAMKNDPALVASNAMPGYYDGVAIRGFELNNWSGYRREGLMFANQASQPIENKERIEVVKGLSALRYGVASPGGIVNWVLKKPTAAALREVNLHVNQYGGVGVHADLGGRAGEDQRFGYRINLAAERERTYLDPVEGNRRMASAYVDWRISPQLLAEFESEYQERALPQQVNIGMSSFAAGVQPFVPTVIGPKTFLGQAWGTYPTEMSNTSARLSWSINQDWTLRTAVQYSDLWRDQHAASIRGASLRANGDFDVTTFYSPDQARRALTSETVLEGRFHTGSLQHELALGVASMDHKVYFGDSLTPVLGVSNIYTPRAVPAPAVANPPPSTLRSRNRENGIFIADTVTFNPQWSVFAGVRQTRPDYALFNSAGAQTSVYDKRASSPSAGVVFKPTPRLAIYASYAEGIEQGGTAPLTALNRNEVLAPLESRQVEVGVKAELAAGASVSAAAFEIDKGLEFVNAANVYVQDGRQVHRGVEVSLAGEIRPGLRVSGGAMWLDPSVERSANANLIGKRPVNAPRRQASLYLDADLRAVPGLALSGGLFHSGDKALDAANTLFVPGYTRIDLGARYAFSLSGRPLTVRAYWENVGDKVYFNSSSFGSFQFGAPRALRLSASTRF